MQRSILMLGQGTNTVWGAVPVDASYYGVVQGPFFLDAGYGSGGVIAISGAPSYDGPSGIVTLTLAATPFPALTTGSTILASGITGTGSFASANGSFTAVAGTSGTTVKYAIGTNLTLTFNSGGSVNTSQGNAGGGYAECAFACVLSRIFHCLGQDTASSTKLISSVNVVGPIPASSAFKAGAGNLQAVTAPANITNPSYWYDATNIDAIPAGQTIGLMQSASAASAGPVNPSLGVVCDSVNAGFCSPFIFPMGGIIAAASLSNGPQYSHLGGSSGNVAGAGFTSTLSNQQDYCPGAFVASWLQWQPATNTDTKGQATATFAFSPTAGVIGTASQLHVAIAGVGALGIQHDVTNVAAVPAGSYCCLQWTGLVDSAQLKVGNAGVHIRPAANNATLLVSGCRNAGGLPWTGPLTWTTFGAPRDDKLYTENMTAIPTAGVFSNLSFQSGSSAYGGSPATLTIQNGANSGDTGAGSGTVSTTTPASGVQPANFVNTSLAVTSSAASTWSFDLTDIVAFTPYNSLLLALTGPASGSTGSVAIQGYSVNFTAPAHLGLTMMGAG